MTIPLAILAFFAMALGLLGTPVWPWFTAFLNGQPLHVDFAGFSEPGLLPMMSATTLIVFLGLGIGWRLYVTRRFPRNGDRDVLDRAMPTVFGWLASRLYFDELYQATVLRWYAQLAAISGWLDRCLWGGIVAAVTTGFRGLGRFNKAIDGQWIDGGFDKGCEELTTTGGVLAWMQAGRAPGYLRVLAVGVLALVVLVLLAATVTGQVKL
uniref:Uncharacterized protein n=1 Tax=mine drainage metagenome TaxID=410659 RepID=E6QMJ6_9ZZZZ